MGERKSLKSMFNEGEWDKLRSWEFGPFVFFYVIYFTIRGLFRNRGTVLTASLAFATALSIVPLLSVVFAAVGRLDDGSSLEPYIQQLFPAAASEIVGYLTNFAETSALEVAGVGALTFYVIGFFLFLAIERVFNIIWASHRKRPIAQKVGAFIGLMTIGPLFLSASFGLSGYARIRFEQFGVDPGVLLLVGPFLLAFVFFTAMNHLLPTTRVHWGASVFAGAFTAALFEAGKFGFNLYVTELILVPYNQVYGALGLFPLFLVWLYVIWIIVLLGAQFAYTAQNLRTLVRVERAAQQSPGRAREHVFSPTIGLELYAPIARAFKSGDGRLSDRDLVALTGYSDAVVRAVVGELSAIGALEIVEDDEGERRLLPAKQLEDIELLPMCEAFFDFDHHTDSGPVEQLLRRYQSVTHDVLSDLSALSFVGQDAESANARKRTPAPQPLARPATAPKTSLPPEPAADADLYESPPSMSTEFGETLDATPKQPDRTVEAAGRPRSQEVTQLDNPIRGTQAALKPMPASVDTSDVAPPQALEEKSGSVDRSTDGIRIHTQDILVEEEELISPTAGAAPLGGQSTAALLKKAVKKKKKEPSIEIDIAGMWDDFEVDNYENALAEASGADLRRTEELEMSDIHGDLGDELSSPPPVPKKK